MKKEPILMLTVLIVIFSVLSVSAYYTGYPITGISKSEIQNRYFDVWIYDSDTGIFNYSYMKGTEYLANGLQVYEHATHSDTYNTLYSDQVVTSTDYLNAWNKMRNDKGSITVLAGYRNIKHNKAIGGAKYSQHQAGIGSNPLTPVGQENAWVYDAETKWGFTYAYAKTGAIHVDSRTTASGFPIVRPDDENVYVFTMEDALKYHDYDNIDVNDFYNAEGYDEDAEVEAFQRDNGLTVDGIIGSGTWSKLTTTK